MTLLIIEGPDGSGKSTLCHAVAEVLERRHPGDTITRRHHSAPSPGVHALDEYVAPLTSYRPGGNQHIVCDRFHVGEFVYPQVLGRPTTMDDAVWAYTEAFLWSRGAVVVYVTPPAEFIARNLTRRVSEGGKLGPTPPLTEVTNWFNEARDRSSTITYQIGHAYDTRVVARALVDLANVAEQYASWLTHFTTYVGAPEPEVLLVGDVRADGTDSSRPAFMPYRATSGHYLFDALARLAPSRRLGVINANDVDDVADFMKTYQSRQARPMKIVALGNLAAKKLDNLDITHGTVPHPQWWRRFLHHFPGEYASAVLTAARDNVDLRGHYPTGSWQVDRSD